ncbi:MAG: hypothetical protein PHI23_03490 [Candidatus Peribacteraceae bacterium]|nr:hypothetical protein [Candidatus Peribacteraceae bacterium]
MPDPKKNPPAVTVPEEVKKKFLEIIELILGSESMNDEERQYWVNILPVMTPEQVQNLKDILTNEREQLAAIDRKYANEIEKLGQDELTRKIEEERHRRQQQRSQSEEAASREEEAKAQQLLNKIEQK